MWPREQPDVLSGRGRADAQDLGSRAPRADPCVGECGRVHGRQLSPARRVEPARLPAARQEAAAPPSAHPPSPRLFSCSGSPPSRGSAGTPVRPRRSIPYRPWAPPSSSTRPPRASPRGPRAARATFSVLGKVFDLAPPLLIGAAVGIVVDSERSFLDTRFGITDRSDQLYALATDHGRHLGPGEPLRVPPEDRLAQPRPVGPARPQARSLRPRAAPRDGLLRRRAPPAS